MINQHKLFLNCKVIYLSFLQPDKSAFLHSAIMDQVDVVSEEIKVSDYVISLVT